MPNQELEKIRESNDWYQGRKNVSQIHWCPECGAWLVHVAEGAVCRSCGWSVNHEASEETSLS